MSKTVRTVVMCSLALWLAGGAVATAQAPAAAQVPVQYEGRIINMQGGGTAYVTLHVDSFSPDQDIQQYLDLLGKGGMPAVTEAMFNAPERGWIKIGNQLGYPLAVIRTRPTENGTMVAALTDRPIMFFESRNGTRSKDYPLGMIILNLDAKGKGTGTVIPAARALFGKDGRVELESYGTQPLQVKNIVTKVQKPKDTK